MGLITVMAALLAFDAFLRFDELINLRVSDISFKDTFCLFLLNRQKQRNIEIGRGPHS